MVKRKNRSMWQAQNMCANLNTFFEPIEGIKKTIRCKSCNRRVEVKNFNQTLCEKCGYKPHR